MGMAKIRIMVIQTQAGAPAIDQVINTLYFDAFGALGAESDYQALANDTRDVFKNRTGQVSGWTVEARAYDMADAKPRPIKARAAPVATVGTGTSGPREVALCLSYYSERNVPRFRGRLFIGPWPKDFLEERPTQFVRENLIQLARDIGNIGGANVDWQLFSPTRNAYSKITNAWIDNEWDTIRQRGRKPTERTTTTTNE
jgi:hypothetical protein